jgi:hypothetical protein
LAWRHDRIVHRIVQLVMYGDDAGGVSDRFNQRADKEPTRNLAA